MIMAMSVRASHHALQLQRRKPVSLILQRSMGDIQQRLRDWQAAGRHIVHEADAKRILQLAGLAVPGKSDAGPYAVKLSSDLFPHKSEHGVVRLGVPATDVPTVAASLQAADPDGEVLVEDMVTSGIVDLIIGCTHDRTFGPITMVNLGGTFVEIFPDPIVRLAPVAKATARAMLAVEPIRTLLDGFRGAPPADLRAATDSIYLVSALFHACRDLVEEIEINPLIVRPQGAGAIAVDALIVMKRRAAGKGTVRAT